MSPSPSLLQVISDDPAATITVLDGSQNIVAKQSGSLHQRLDDGLYKVRVRVASAVEERLVALDDHLPVQSFGRPKISSPVPVDGTTQSHEYHQMAVGNAFDHPGATLGAGSRLLVSAREWSPNLPRGHPDPAGALSLVMPSGERRPFASFAQVYSPGDAFAIGCVVVDPGLYGVELTFADGGRQCRPLQAVKDWATQIFMLFHDIEGERLPNLGGGSVIVAKKAVTEDEQTRVAEIALDALTQHRPLLRGFLQDVLYGKFEQPLLGVIGAHLLLRNGLAGGAFRTVFDNVSRMLGADNPDVIALATKVAPAIPRSVTQPPMLRASWDLLIEASGAVPELFEKGSRAAQLAEGILPAGAWLMWQSEAGHDEASGIDAKLEIVRNFVQAQAEARGRAFTNESQFSLAPDHQASVNLSDSARSDLCKALGVPQPTLDGLLARLKVTGNSDRGLKMAQHAIDLSRTLRWQGASSVEAAMLDDLQVNILDGHGRKSTRNLFIEFVDAARARAFLRELAPRITSAAEQLSQARAHREQGIIGPPIIGLAISHAGYRALGVEEKAPVTDDGGAFAGGMAARASELGDDPGKIEPPYQGAIHAMILIGAEPDGPDAWGSLAAEDVETDILNMMQNAARVITTEIGRAIFRDNGPMPGSNGRKIEGIEHFGYVDGRSQPLLLDELVERERDESDGISVWSPRFPLQQVLVPDPGSAADGTAFGSFFVFRKLEQNVAAFKDAEEALGNDLGLGELAGAMLVGRFEDGTPVTLQRDDGLDNPVMNNFDYASDQAGLRCPFHAHIRKTNPRGDTVTLLGATLESERSHIMARRGMPFGQRNRVVDPSDKPSGGVGLMFMAFQANLRDQFEFTQASWANSTQFATGFAGLSDPGRDPIIGQRGQNDATLITMRDKWGWATAGEHKVTFEEHVTFRGGEYFFVPAKSTLASI